MSLKRRFEGVLVGALVGDVLGARFEGLDWDQELLLSTAQAHTHSFGLEKRIRHTRTSATRYTDDTAMTRVLAHSLIECGKFDANHLARGCDTFLAWAWLLIRHVQIFLFTDFAKNTSWNHGVVMEVVLSESFKFGTRTASMIHFVWLKSSSMAKGHLEMEQR